jgi:predicted ATPase
MIISRVILKNWRNFIRADVGLQRRVFLVGPNASGKSNFLDVFRFLRDIAKTRGGGLQEAVEKRGGLTKIRCLAARRDPEVTIEIHLSNDEDKSPIWKYEIGLKQEPHGNRQPYLSYERVWHLEQMILKRPDDLDIRDNRRLTATHLESINMNDHFRDIAKFFESVSYYHIVPQLIRSPEQFVDSTGSEDFYGRKFLERIAQTPEKIRNARFKKIEQVIRYAVPQLTEISNKKDEKGFPHIEAVFKHWRPRGSKQNEKDFSDGTLRLMGFLWALLDAQSVLLLEEPELSLHTAVIRRLPGLIWKLQNKTKRQVMISTHSLELLDDKGIGGEETLLLIPHDDEGTEIKSADSFKEIKALLEEGFSIGEASIPYSEPKKIHQLNLDIFNE